MLDPGHPFYLHEFLEDSSLHLPMVVKPPRVSKKIMHLFSVPLKQACAAFSSKNQTVTFPPLTAEPGTSCSAGENQSQIRK